MPLFVTIHYTLFDFVGHLILRILMTITLNQTIRGQTFWRSVNLETDITTCSHMHNLLKLTILLSVTHVNHTHFCAIRKSQSHGLDANIEWP